MSRSPCQRSHHRSPPAATHGWHAAGPARSATAGPRVLHRLVDGEDEAGGLRGRRDGVDLDDGRLPHAGREIVGNVLGEDVDAVPAVVLKMSTGYSTLNKLLSHS